MRPVSEALISMRALQAVARLMFPWGIGLADVPRRLERFGDLIIGVVVTNDHCWQDHTRFDEPDPERLHAGQNLVSVSCQLVEHDRRTDFDLSAVAGV